MANDMKGKSNAPFFIAGLAYLAAALIPTSAAAQQLCDQRGKVLTQLERKYGEVPVAIGVADGSLVELLTTKDGMTWTIILTSPQGLSCLIASGEGWRPLERAESEPQA